MVSRVGYFPPKRFTAPDPTFSERMGPQLRPPYQGDGGIITKGVGSDGVGMPRMVAPSPEETLGHNGVMLPKVGGTPRMVAPSPSETLGHNGVIAKEDEDPKKRNATNLLMSGNGLLQSASRILLG